VRRIASNYLWHAGAFLRHPLVDLNAAGEALSVAVCPDPDRMPFTEFHAGVLVLGFPSDYRSAFERMKARSAEPLAELLLRERIPVRPGVAVVLSGLDYATMRLTPRARIRLL